MNNTTTTLPNPYPYLVSSEDGYFMGLDGHVGWNKLLRTVMSETGMTLFDLTDLRLPATDALRQWIASVTEGWWRVAYRDDPTTWGDDKQESMDDVYWPYEFDQFFLVCDESDPGARPATYRNVR